MTFESSHKKSPLQAADMLAYTTYQWHMKEAYPREVELNFPIIPGFFRLIQNVAADGGVYNEESMQRLILQERINRVNKGYDPFMF